MEEDVNNLVNSTNFFGGIGMENKENILALIISLKREISNNKEIDDSTKRELISFISKTIDEVSKTDGVAMTNAIGRLVTKMSFFIGLKRLKLNKVTIPIWEKLTSIDVNRKRDLNNSSFISGGVSSFFGKP